MSSNQMVTVPRDELEAACQRFAKAQIFDFSRRMRALLAQPAEQARGEPVGEVIAFSPGLHEIAWANGCMPALGSKLYTHADPAEVERLRLENKRLWTAYNDQQDKRLAAEDERSVARAQLAERDALLRGAAHLADRLHKSSLGMRRQALAELLAFLSDASASAEPSAPVEHDDATLIDALRTCEKWFVKHSPTAPLIGGFGDAEHPMLTCIRAALTLKQ